MCGIVGYLGSRPAREILLTGLEKLEYRGYDSAGISLLIDNEISSVRAVGNLSYLHEAVERNKASAAARAVTTVEREATIGIGHTRWATHGRVDEINAHPHSDSNDRVHVVVNGIVENYLALKNELIANGAHFSSQTDAETIAHLISFYYKDDFLEAVRLAYLRLEGHFSFVAMGADHPELLVGARLECPLIIGRGDGEQFIASAIPAFLQHTRDTQVVENGELVAVTPDDATFYQAADGAVIGRAIERIDWDTETAEKGGYETFMLKEIHEQADALAETVADRTVREDAVDLQMVGALTEADLTKIRRIVVVACGTSYHAGLIGRYAIEELARLPVEVEVASEYRYRNPIISESDLVIGITQSGETADTLAAMRLARKQGAKVIAITNVMGSQATRDADGVLYTRAGLEVGVAATKTFICQVAVMYLCALKLAELRTVIAKERLTALIAELKHLPHWVDQLLVHCEQDIQAAVEAHWQADFFLYLGRHIGLPVALEGALKLKEISYIATDAYAAGEMKHGPIALLDEQTPVVCVATELPILDKLVSNVKTVQARGAHVIAIATEGDEVICQHAEQTIFVPRTDWLLQPLLSFIPLQLLAYGIARKRGLNVDQPRNLAKTVTVE